MSEPKIVMVVDDDAALRESVCELLEEVGYQVVPADSGVAALDGLRSAAQKPDVILLDLMMPVMNGWQFRTAQLSDPDLATIPVVVMTANRDLRGITADEVVLKPVKLAKLLDVVRRHAGGDAAAGVGNTPSSSLNTHVLAGGGELRDPMPPADSARFDLEVARQSAARFQFIAETMPQKVFTANANGDVDYVNQQWLKFTGLTFEQIKDWGWTQFIHADDLEENVRRWRHSIETGEPFELEQRFRAADGTYRWHLSRAHLVRESAGQAAVWLGSNTDIDDVKRAAAKTRRNEQDLYALFMQAPAPICVFKGEDLVFEMANDLYFKVAGRGPDIIGRTLLDAIPESRGQGFDDLLHGVMSSGNAFVGKEVPLKLDKHGDGSLVDTWWTFVYAPLRDPAGVVDRVMALVHDVTEQVLAGKEREGHIEELQRMIRFSEVFVGILGHDLRNPLSAITTAASLLESRADSEKIATPVSRIVLSADRMERMISQLLDFTRIRLGRGIPLVPMRTDLVGVARSIIDELQPVHDREIQLVSAGEGSGTWDRDRLGQLLSNLVGNACQHGTAGAPVTIEIDGSAPDRVSLSVSNRGAIPADLLPAIFEPLHAEDRQEKRTGASGLGLGLYITQRIAAAHGGSILAESTGGGTRFVVELPRHGIGGVERVLDVAGFGTGTR